MQDIFVFKPYQFVPPVQARWVSRLNRLFKFHRHLIWRLEGVRGHEVRNAHLLQESLDQGHSILLAPNHSRTADPIALGFLGEALQMDMYAMASWHLFNVNPVMRWFIRSVGAFSVNREGMDRKAVDTAVQLLVKAERPMVVFPEGATSRTNDRLMPFLDGLSVIARAAAKQRHRQDEGKAVIHPVAFKYVYQGDIRRDSLPILKDLESRLTWYPERRDDFLGRIRRIAEAQLMLKELERLGEPQQGDWNQRTARLIDAYLVPLEEKWLKGRQTGTSSSRIKSLRGRIIPRLIEEGEHSPATHQYLADVHDTYIAHQMACHPIPYLEECPTADRVRETVERLQEDATDQATLFKPLKCFAQIGPAIPVPTVRERRGEGDSIMNSVAESLQKILDELSTLSPPFAEAE